jgi:hypothetical protein
MDYLKVMHSGRAPAHRESVCTYHGSRFFRHGCEFTTVNCKSSSYDVDMGQKARFGLPLHYCIPSAQQVHVFS